MRLNCRREVLDRPDRERDKLAAARGLQFTGAALLTILIASLGQLVPGGNAMPRARQEAHTVAAVWPQGWNFFDDEPRGPVVQAFSVSSEGRVSALDQLQMGTSNMWGVSRNHLTRLVELNTVAGEVPADAWLDCAELTPSACIDRAVGSRRVAVSDTARNPSVCGHLLLAVESPARWTSNTRLWLDNWKILKIADVAVSCAA